MQNKIRELEHISLRAWMALETDVYDGWVLRFANGYTGRANSVQALDSSSLAIEEKIEYCENWYTARDLPTIFRLTEAMQPSDLDERLDKRAYERYNETLVQTASLSSMNLTIDRRFSGHDIISDEWLAKWGEWNNISPANIATAKAMLSQKSATQACFAWIDDVALGLAVREGQFAGLFDIVVKPESRGQGIGMALVSSLLEWSKQAGAKTGYLQVMANNSPALTLYDKLGFHHHHRYWYRRRELE